MGPLNLSDTSCLIPKYLLENDFLREKPQTIRHMNGLRSHSPRTSGENRDLYDTHSPVWPGLKKEFCTNNDRPGKPDVLDGWPLFYHNCDCEYLFSVFYFIYFDVYLFCECNSRSI